MNQNIYQDELAAFQSSGAEELFINNPSYAEWVLADGKVVPRPLEGASYKTKDLTHFLQDFAFAQNKRLDLQAPSAGGLWGSYRWQACIPPVAGSGGLLSLRKIFPKVWTLKDFAPKQEAMSRIEQVIEEKKTLVVYGGPGEGKTSFLTALCCHYFSDSRVLFFEDCEEIPLAHPRWLRLLKSQPNRHTGLVHSTGSNLKSSLRLRPSVFVFGETRDKEDVHIVDNARLAIPSPCLSTFHASCEDSAQKRWLALGGNHEDIEFVRVPARRNLVKTN